MVDTWAIVMVIDNEIMCETNLISLFSAFLLRLTGNALDARNSGKVTFAQKINYIGLSFPMKGWGRIAQWQRRWERQSLNNILCNINAPLKDDLSGTSENV